MSFPKISELHPQVIEWAKPRFLATAKPLQQMAVTWEEIQEAQVELESLIEHGAEDTFYFHRRTHFASRPVVALS